MKILFVAFALILSFSTPALAQDDSVQAEPEPDAETPLLEMFDRFLRGFMAEVEPQMRDLEQGLQALEPDMQRLLGAMRDMTRYHPPEVLPNGDILIRRRQSDIPDSDAPDAEAPDFDPPDPDAPSGRVDDPFEL